MGDDGKPFMSSVPGIDKATLEACKSLGAARNKVNSQFNTYGFVLEKENYTNVVVESIVQITPISFAKLVNNELVKHKDGLSAMATRHDIRADQELKENMVIIIPNLEGKGDVLHTIRVESVDNDDVLGAHGESFIGADYVVEKGQKANANDIYMGDLRNLYDALKEMENVILNVITSTAEKVCNIVNDSEKVVDESESLIDDIYDETAQYMANGGANDASFLEDEDYDTYDSYDLEGLIEDQTDLAKAFDHTRMISKSIFVTNFPDSSTSNDLWNLCQAYGTVPIKPDKPGASSFVSALKGIPDTPLPAPSTPAMVLDESCMIISKWGEVLELEECKDDFFARKRICIKTKQEDNILEKFKIIVNGKIFMVRAKELFVWSPALKDVPEVVYCSDNDFVTGVDVNNAEINKQTNLEAESDNEAVSKTYFGEHTDELGNENDSVQPSNEKEISNDPFNIYDLLNKRDEDYSRSEGCSSRILEDAQKIDEHFSTEVRGNGVKHKEGGSILEILDEMIKVGQTMGFSMDGCLGSKAKKEWIRELNIKHKVSFLTLQETKMDNISAMDVKFLWGNCNFDHLFNEALGNSGGILCTWDPNVFHKEHHIISDNFVALYGTWIPNKVKLLVISVYAPQSVPNKRVLWNYISSLITRWNGESMVMGDFNEVRRMEERWGSVFNVQGASAFNNFITNSGHLSDHRPILLREVITDYGAIPFRLYHSWFNLQGFDHMVTHTWNSTVLDDRNGMIRFKKKLQILKKEIRVWVADQKKKQSGRVSELKSKLSDIDKALDQGGVNDDLLLSRMDFTKQLQDVKSSEARDSMQKAKIQWAIEGDENSKFFHGMASILVNGSPTSEFQFHCGLKQGDPLAPYLFILIMESLHLSFSCVIDAGIFTGVRIDSSLMISHLFYADDAVFIGERSQDNLKGISSMEFKATKGRLLRLNGPRCVRNLWRDFPPNDANSMRGLRQFPIKSCLWLERDLQCGVYGLEDDELPSEYYMEDSNSKSICILGPVVSENQCQALPTGIGLLHVHLVNGMLESTQLRVGAMLFFRSGCDVSCVRHMWMLAGEAIVIHWMKIGMDYAYYTPLH
ncbi:RNA-directed DNA polymerase, eukaryota [Tanacetum coccineum]